MRITCEKNETQLKLRTAMQWFQNTRTNEILRFNFGLHYFMRSKTRHFPVYSMAPINKRKKSRQYAGSEVAVRGATIFLKKFCRILLSNYLNGL